MNTKSQSELILNDLRQGLSITPLSALSTYGCMRLSARIGDIKKDMLHPNEQIVTLIEKNNGKRYASYKLVRVNIESDSQTSIYDFINK